MKTGVFEVSAMWLCILAVSIVSAGTLIIFKFLDYDLEVKKLDRGNEEIESAFPNQYKGEFSLTWYSPKELGKPVNELKTSTGFKPRNQFTVAVDPKVIPYHSVIYIEGYGYFIAEDCGSAIKGNKIDIFTKDYNHAIKQGRRKAKVWIMKNVK